MQIASGLNHIVLISDDGCVWTFGKNEHGQLGIGDNKNRNIPTKIQRGKRRLPEDVKIIDAICGNNHTVLLSDDGRIWTFGSNCHGQLGIGNKIKINVPTKIKRRENEFSEDVKIVKVGCGEYHTVIISDDGRIWTFGNNTYGQLGHGYGIRNINLNIAGNGINTPTEIQRRTNDLPEDVKIVDVSCGKFHTVIISDDNRIWTFGSNTYGQLGHGDRIDKNVPTNIRIQRNKNKNPEDVRIIGISCGIYHTVLLSDDGHVWTFGNNEYGQLGHGDMKNRNVPTRIRRAKNKLPKDVKIIGISCGYYYTVLLSDDGRIWTFGYNEYFGQLGLRNTRRRNVPTDIQMNINELPEDVKFIGVSHGEYHIVLLSNDGRVWTFGANMFGQLGHGDRENRNIPTEIQNFSLRQLGSLTKSANKT